MRTMTPVLPAPVGADTTCRSQHAARVVSMQAVRWHMCCLTALEVYEVLHACCPDLVLGSSSSSLTMLRSDAQATSKHSDCTGLKYLWAIAGKVSTCVPGWACKQMCVQPHLKLKMG